jgi:hypothetical protein
MHKENLVVSVIAQGKICRENSGQVYLPYGTEYALRIKNLDTARRVFATITIDGENVNDWQLVIGAGQTSELKGFVKNRLAHNSFKFIEWTDKIRQHKGDRPDWGIITVSFQFEEVAYSNPYTDYLEQQKRYKEMLDKIERARRAREIEDARRPWKDMPRPYPNTPWISWKNENESGILWSSTLSNSQCINSASCQGLTVPGSVVDQAFASTQLNGTLGTAHTLSLQLVGKRPDSRPVQVVRTARRVSCPTCGAKQKGNAKYCSECSTCLL